MKHVTAVLCLLAASAVRLPAENLSFTGTLNTPQDVFETTFTLTAADAVTFQRGALAAERWRGTGDRGGPL